MGSFDYSSVRLSSWDEFKLHTQQFSENWAYRGQANAEWVLNNAIERTDFIKFDNNIEAHFVAEFQRGARNYLTKDETPEHLIEWLASMQHQFGSALKENQNLINEKLFEVLFYQNNKSLVFPVEPFRMNRRYSLQQSIFVSTGTSVTPLMEQLRFLEDELPKAVIKLEIPATEKKLVLRNLQMMNLHRASLFPDLDGYALSLKFRYNNMKSPDEVGKELKEKDQDQNYPYFP